MWGKDDGDYDSLTSRDETPDLNKKEAKEPKIKKGQRAQNKKENE
jgi:hypothetical protein